MRRRFMQIPGILTFMLAFMCTSAQASGDFALLDHDGRFHQISRYADQDAVVLLVFQAGDETSSQALDSLLQISEQVRGQSPDAAITYLLINAAADTDRAALQSAVQQQGIDLPVLQDDAQVVLTTLQAEQLAEVFVLNPQSQRLLFRSALGAAQDSEQGRQQREALDSALRAIVAGRPITAEPQQSSAADIDFPYQQALQEQTLSYQHDIAPLLQRRCAHCHVEEGLAPWAMNRHLMVLGWSPMMRETIVTRRMPPGQIDGYVGDWQQTHELPPDELAMLIHWIDQGAPNDDEVDPLTQVPAETDGWPLGEPDLIVEVPEQQLPATGVVDFLVKTAGLSLPEDKWLRAVAYDVGDKSVLHSLMIYARDRDAEISSDADLIDPAHAEFFSIFVPGEAADTFPDGAAYRLSADRDLTFKIRYLTSGRETVDRTRIGFYFQDSEPEMLVRSIDISNQEIEIPPQVAQHRETSQSQALDSEAYLSSFSPHAHGRAASMQLRALFPDGSDVLIANVANYNFNWQLTYRLREPMRLPAGTRLRADTVYDNSLANPLNADPARSVRWGLSDRNEMFNHYVRILQPR